MRSPGPWKPDVVIALLEDWTNYFKSESGNDLRPISRNFTLYP